MMRSGIWKDQNRNDHSCGDDKTERHEGIPAALHGRIRCRTACLLFDGFSKYDVKFPEGRRFIFESEAINLETKLESIDDAAHMTWGGSWRMPTHEEWKELKEKCIWIWTSINGHVGYKIISKKNGKSIFLPAAGQIRSTFDDESNGFGEYGNYWSSSIGVINTGFPSEACGFFFYSSSHEEMGYDRDLGLSVRPVTM